MTESGVLDHVLVEHQPVGDLQQRREAHVDLGLARGADLVVVDLDRDAELAERQHHLGPKVLVMVHRGDREVALFITRLVAEVLAALLGPRVPHAFDGIDVVVALVVVLVETDRVEDVELGLGPEVGDVGDPRPLQIVLGLAGDVARVAGVELAGQRVLHEGVDHECRVLGEGVHDRGVRVRNQDHVRLLDLLEAADRRAVETEALLEGILGNLFERDREVLHQSGKVREPDVEELGAVLLA